MKATFYYFIPSLNKKNYTGIFKEGGNVIKEQSGNTHSSIGEKASWTAKRI
jgi:hypothetical protein